MSVCASTSLNAPDHDLQMNRDLLRLIDFIEVILNCMFILGYPQAEEGGNSASRNKLAGEEGKTEQTQRASPTKPGMTNKFKSSFNGLNN